VELTLRYARPSVYEPPRLSLALDRDPRRLFATDVAAGEPIATRLLQVREVVTRRWFLPMTASRAARIADPVVTVGPTAVRFEGFSPCAGVYVRVDLLDDVEPRRRGTTNVEFGPALAASLARVGPGDPLRMEVGLDEVELGRVGDTAIERRVDLPERWVRSFGEVHLVLSDAFPVFAVPAEAVRRMWREGRRAPGEGARVTPHRDGLRVTLDPSAGVAVGGLERLRILDPVLRPGQQVTVAADGRGATVWSVDGDGHRFTLALSPALSRGFSGEGRRLDALAEADPAAVEVASDLVLDDLVTRGEASTEALGGGPIALAALHRLAGAGQVGFDEQSQRWFHRALPFGERLREPDRLARARDLEAAGAVRRGIDPGEWLVDARDPAIGAYRVRLGEVERCTCAWFGRFGGARGPCAHVLGARLAAAR
jgi:hypothetical protein